MSTAATLTLIAIWCGTPVPMGTLTVQQVNACREKALACVNLKTDTVEGCFKEIKIGG